MYLGLETRHVSSPLSCCCCRDAAATVAADVDGGGGDSNSGVDVGSRG